MGVLKKIKKLFNRKSYTQEEEDLRIKICDFFIKQLKLEEIHRIDLKNGGKFEGEFFHYLSLNFKAINVLNSVYATIMTGLAYEFSHALSDVYDDVKLKDFFKFHISLQGEDLFSTICVAFSAAQMREVCSCSRCSNLFLMPEELKGIYNDFLKKKNFRG